MWFNSWAVILAKSKDMFHKEIKFTLLLSCLFILGNCQQPLFCTPPEREQLSQNVCSNVSFAIGCLCLYLQPSSFAFEFQSNGKCEEAKQTLTDMNVVPEVSDCVSGLQLYVNYTILEKVCEIDGIVSAFYLQERNLCIETIISSPLDRCHRLECVTEDYDHICKNLTLVDNVFKHLKEREGTFTETQQYIIKFNNTRRGERQCNKTANILKSSRSSRRYGSRLYANNCGSPEKTLSIKLNLRGLNWTCERRQVMRLTFEEKYLNESICRNVTQAQDLFFSDDNKFETFTVTYTTRSTNACNSLVECLTNSTDPNINATLSISNCEQNPLQIQGTMNYETLKLVCSKTDPMIATVVQLRNNVQPTTEEPNTDGPGIGLIIG